MTTRNRPDYQVYFVNLAVAGTLDIPAIGTRVVMAGAYSGASVISINGGYQILSGGSPTSAIVNVQIGKTPGDPLPFQVGSSVKVENKFDWIRLQWLAQSGTYAVIVVSDDADGNGVEVVAPPSVTLGSMSLVEGGNTAIVDVNGSLQTSDLMAIALKPWGGPADKISGSNGAASGAVRVMAGPVGTNAQTQSNPSLNTLPQSGAAAAPQIQPGSMGASSSMGNTASGAITIVAPASNVNGIVIRAAALAAGSTATSVICGGTSAPSSVTSNPAVLTSYGGALAILPREIFLPAGQGLYVYNSALANVANLTYDIE